VKGVVAWIKRYPFRTWLAFALTVVLALIAGIIRSGALPPAGPEHLGASAGATAPYSDTVTAEVTAGGATLNHPAGATLSVPAGALPAGTVVSLTKGKAATMSQLGALQRDGVSWDIAASIEPPSLPVTLVLPYEPAAVPEGTRPLVTTYDELSGWWVPVRTNAVPETGRLIAELPGFSLKTWILDRVPDPAKSAEVTESWLEYQGRALLQPRAGRPQCTGRKVPSWVKQIVISPDPGVAACVRADGAGFAIEAANTRAYPVTLDLDVPFAKARASTLDATVDGLMARLPGGVLLLPTGTSAVSYDPPPAPVGAVRARIRRDGDTMVRWLVLAAVNATPAARANFGPAAAECGRRALPGPAPVASRVGVLLDCLARALTAQLRAAGLDPAKDLWRSDRVGQLSGAVYQQVGALRWVRGLQAGDFARLAGEVTAADGRGAAGPVTVLARWTGAPRWARPPGVRPLFALAAAVPAAPATAPPPAPVGASPPPGGAAGAAPAGGRVTARLAGRDYPDSTAAPVACAGPPATLTYQLAGKYRRFTAVAGVAETAPPDLAARFDVTVDGRPVSTLLVDQRRTAPVDVEVPGARTLVISAVRTAGACPPPPQPSGILGAASLFP
jgi:NPCBM/NEW2 domain